MFDQYGITSIIKVQLCQHQIVPVSLFSRCFEKVQLFKNENITYVIIEANEHF